MKITKELIMKNNNEDFRKSISFQNNGYVVRDDENNDIKAEVYIRYRDITIAFSTYEEPSSDGYFVHIFPDAYMVDDESILNPLKEHDVMFFRRTFQTVDDAITAINDRVTASQVIATLSSSDNIALKAMLYRPPHLEMSKTTPAFKVDAIKYLRSVNKSLTLAEGKAAVDMLFSAQEYYFGNRTAVYKESTTA